MIIGVPKEIKDKEFRVSVTPTGTSELVNKHIVLVQKNAGVGSGFLDKEYLDAGAKILDSIEEIYRASDMIAKVKEPIEYEYPLIKKDQIIITYLHLSSNRKLVRALMDSGSVCIAYETIEKNGYFPLLAPMSEVAGRAAAIMGAYYLSSNFNGQGLLISGISGIIPGNVLILGAGVAAKNAAKIASGLGAKVTIMSPFISELREIELGNYFSPNVSTLILSRSNLNEEIKKADILISAVYVRGARTPILVTRDMVKAMKKGSVIVAIDIDQGSSIETAKPTNHDNPIYTEEGVVHYCVTNIPGIFPKTSTLALTNLTLPYIKEVADCGISVFKSNVEILGGLNIFKGRITNSQVAKDTDMENFILNMSDFLINK